MRIAHASIDERGKAQGGALGDNNSKEVCVRDYYIYSGGWDFVLRCTYPAMAEKMAQAAERLAKDNLIGYDQSNRNSAHTLMKKNDYNIDSFIASKVKAETDCSAFMTLCAIIGGIKELEYTGNAPTTSTMKTAFKNTGRFQCLTSECFKRKTEYLKRGDILVKQGKHTVMVLDNGSMTGYSYAGVDYTPVFNPTYYANRYADLKAAFGLDSGKLFNHFVNFGMAEHRQAIDTFNVDVYKNRYADLRNALGNDIRLYYKHYCMCGKKEGRNGI